MYRHVQTFALVVGVTLCAALPAAAQRDAARPTCEASAINPDSYALATSVQALVVTQDRARWWERFSIARAVNDLQDLNIGSMLAAERAAEIDAHNLLAHAILARQYVVLGIDADRAGQEWQTVLDGGGAIVWTATLYDVDVKSYFLIAFDRRAMRVYRFGEVAAPFETHLGMPKFPGPDRERLWRAWAGCIDPGARPEVMIPWADVREIKAGNWVLEFKLARKATMSSDNGKRADLDTFKVNLHGGTPTLQVRTTQDPVDPWKIDYHTVGIGPLAYQERVRRTLVKFVDPDGRVALPKASRSAGW